MKGRWRPANSEHAKTEQVVGRDGGRRKKSSGQLSPHESNNVKACKEGNLRIDQSASAVPTMKIFVKELTGKITSLKVVAGNTVADVKEMMEAEMGISTKSTGDGLRKVEHWMTATLRRVPLFTFFSVIVEDEFF
ncbi:hypothetical protein GPALN_012359 [Globodera pallida]|nr:hypothetical protein GPALN_012359 [Globodera pallida]